MFVQSSMGSCSFFCILLLRWLLEFGRNCCCSVTKSCPTLCDPMDCSTPGFPVLPISGACSDSYPLSQWCYLTISSSAALFSSCPQSFPASGSFPMSQLFVSGGQSIEASASASVLPMNIQGWFPLGGKSRHQTSPKNRDCYSGIREGCRKMATIMELQMLLQRLKCISKSEQTIPEIIQRNA